MGNSSKNGTLVAVPYYFNLAPNYDATLTSRYYSSRGVRVDPELRYLNDDTRSQLNVEYLFHDDATGEARSFVDWRHVTRFAPLTRLRVDAANVSDQDYFEDFGVGFEGTSVTFLNRHVDLRHDDGAWSFGARAQDYQVIDRELPDDESPYRILPQLTALGRWDELFRRARRRAVCRSDQLPARRRRPAGRPASTHCRRSAGVPTGAAPFSPRMPAIATRSTRSTTSRRRPTNHPAVRCRRPASIPASSSNAPRAHGATPADARTAPAVPLRAVPQPGRPPGLRHGVPDLNMVQLFRDNRYVGADRVGDANQVSVGVTTRLLDATRGRQFLSATLGQAFYFEDPRVRLPDEPVAHRSVVGHDRRTGPRRLQELECQVRVPVEPRPEPGRTHRELSCSTRPRRAGSSTPVIASAATNWSRSTSPGPGRLSQRWRGFARVVYSLREDKTLDQFVGFEYSSCCWAVRLITRRYISSRTGDADTSFGLQLELKGLSSVGVDNEAFLRDAIRGYSALPSGPRT